MRADEPELRNCPLCGSGDVSYSGAGSNWTNGPIVYCRECGLTFPCIDESVGRLLWNTRTGDARMSFGDGSLRERVAELENELAGLREKWGCDLVTDEDADAPQTDANAPITDNVRKCPQCDPVELLRSAAESDVPIVYLHERLDASPLLPSEHSRVLDALADMVERGYVRREDYDAAAKMCRFYAKRIARLEAERDYWRGQVGRCLKRAWPDHAPGVMGYPDRDGCAEPSALVIKTIDRRATLLEGAWRELGEWKARCETAREEFQCAREERDEWMRRYGEVVNSRNEVVSSRNGGPAPESGAAAGQVDSDGGDADTREKLEADVRGYILCTPLSTVDYDDGMMLVEKMAEWLDRQAAITEREVAG